MSFKRSERERDQEKATETERNINIMRKTYIYTHVYTHTAREEIPLVQEYRGREQRAKGESFLRAAGNRSA